jgi:hypothetical protein
MGEKMKEKIKVLPRQEVILNGIVYRAGDALPDDFKMSAPAVEKATETTKPRRHKSINEE